MLKDNGLGWIHANKDNLYNMKIKINKEGDLCRHCLTPTILKECRFNISKFKKSYFYTHTIYCPKCKAFYHQERYKINKEDYNKNICLKNQNQLNLL